MLSENAPRQSIPEGEGFEITPDFLLANKEVVTDFFGDNRQTYALLKKSSATRPSVALETKELLAHDEDGGKSEEQQRTMPIDDLPLDPSLITQERAKHVADFFRENPLALNKFLQYREWYTKNSPINEPTH